MFEKRLKSEGHQLYISKHRETLAREKQEELRRKENPVMPERQDLKESKSPESHRSLKDIIEQLSIDGDYEKREEACGLLRDYPDCSFLSILKRLLQDRNYLVQIEAIEAAGAYGFANVSHEVETLFSSIHPLVRGYAYAFYCDNCPDKEEARRVLSVINEKNTWARINLNVSLFILGEEWKLDELLRNYYRWNYRNQIVLLNSLSFFYDELQNKDKRKIKSFLEKHRHDERGRAVEEAFRRLEEME